jgi:hypothetical protein
MKRYLLGLALLFCLLVSADAQFSCLNLLGCSAGGSVASFTGVGDVVSGAQAWYGLRAYNAAYATANGKLVNLTRASDSATCDILANASTGGFGVTANCTGSGTNGVSASSFCNATTCTANTLYDQSGANNCSAAPCPATQATVASQPTLSLSCQNSLPCLTFNGTSTILNATSGGTGSQPFTVAAVAERTGAFTSAGQIFLSDSSQSGIGFTSSANTVAAFAGSNATATASDSAAHSLIGVINNTTTNVVVDGTNTTGTASTNLWALTTCIGAQCGGSFFMTGDFMEGGLWPSGFTSTQYGNVCHNQRLYWGTGGTC